MKKFKIFAIAVFAALIFSTGTAKAQLFEIGNLEAIGLNIDQKGKRLDVLKGFGLTESLFGFARYGKRVYSIGRFGIGIGLMSFYFGSDIPDLKYADSDYPHYGDSTRKHGVSLCFLPVSLYFSPITWWSLNKKFVKSVHFYWEYWLLKGSTAGKRCPDPQISKFSEFGICLNPFGRFASFSVFYRSLTIPEGNIYIKETDYTRTTFVTYIGGTRSSKYHFPGYVENFFGVSVKVYLGCMTVD